MNIVKDWWALAIAVLGWIVTATMHWANVKNKLNGLGGRVKRVEESSATHGGRMDSFERELREYRRDAQDAVKTSARIEKGQEAIQEAISHGNLAIGSQLHALEKLVQDRDVNTQVRLTRIETVNSIEKKIGLIPE